ncbi:dihydropteroate synthase [Galbitalea sp. SE-J8]|uniref:dihydropteroate synthase n=1 Tax=Galbitalea sp. SE-J8 TaxID=3054952 RepID=UPI00259CABC0|nr:dihydropteroate synthase [Galbitalea sp. SE-J8]MDM4761649.1 dihydropteroate synthase [Galbitalea sp. SE-J8]
MTSTAVVALARQTTPRPRPRIVGVLNVTPDSFSDGGRFDRTDAAIAHGLRLIDEGADILDIGGESTRPGAAPVDVETEIARVVPVIRALAGRGAGLSVDTLHARTAAAAIEAGAEIVNDVSGGLADPEMCREIARAGVTYIASHWRGRLDGTDDAAYTDVVTDVRAELKARIAELIVWGVNPRRIVLDPGLGFSKTATQNWALLGHLPELATLGYPVLVGASRKRFLAEFAPEGAPAEERDAATSVVSVLAAQAGAWGVRVHSVAATRAALDVWERWERGASS